MQAGRLEVGVERAGQEGHAEGLAPVDGQEVSPMGVDVAPHLVGNGNADQDPELGPVHRTTHRQRHQADHDHGPGPATVPLAVPAEEEPHRHQHRPDGAGVPRGAAVEVGPQDQGSGQGDPPPRGTLDHAEQGEHASDGQCHAPCDVLAVDERGGRQVHEHRSAGDGCDQHTVRGRLGPPEHRPTSKQQPDPPKGQGTEHPRGQPGDEQRRSRQPPVPPTGEHQDRHAHQGREQAEVGVLPSAVDEGLDPQRSVRNRQMAVEHRPGLEFVEVARGRGPERARSPRPEIPQDPQVGHTHQHDSRDDGDREASTAGSYGGLLPGFLLGDRCFQRRCSTPHQAKSSPHPSRSCNAHRPPSAARLHRPRPPWIGWDEGGTGPHRRLASLHRALRSVRPAADLTRRMPRRPGRAVSGVPLAGPCS